MAAPRAGSKPSAVAIDAASGGEFDGVAAPAPAACTYCTITVLWTWRCMSLRTPVLVTVAPVLGSPEVWTL